MSEMKGNCSNFKTDLKNEMSIWDSNGLLVNSRAQKIPLQVRARLVLSEQGKVKYKQKPEKEFPVDKKRYGGVFNFKSDKSGQTRVSAGGKVWYDVVEKSTGKIVDADEFEMQTKCNKIFKVVKYSLKPNSEYFLQVSSAKTDTMEFLISELSE